MMPPDAKPYENVTAARLKELKPQRQRLLQI